MKINPVTLLEELKNQHLIKGVYIFRLPWQEASLQTIVSSQDGTDGSLEPRDCQLLPLRLFLPENSPQDSPELTPTVE